MPVTIQPTSLKYKDSNNEFQTVTAIKGDSGVYYGETEPSDPNVKVWIDPNGEAETFVQDVQVNGVSVLTDGIANVPAGSTSDYGVFKLNLYGGLQVGSDGTLKTNGASASNVKSGTDGAKPLTPLRTSDSAFYGLAKAAGADMASSSNPIGTYTDEAKIAIQKMLGIYEAPWELIREDTFNNASSSDVEISVDSNGQPFELTSAIFMIFADDANTDTTWGNSGDLRFVYGDGTNDHIRMFVGAINHTAGSTTIASMARVIADGNLVMGEYSIASTVSGQANMRTANYLLINNPRQLTRLFDAPIAISKVVIKTIEGPARYIIYGKRKWQ